MRCQRAGAEWLVCEDLAKRYDEESGLKWLERKRLYDENPGYWIYGASWHGVDAEFEEHRAHGVPADPARHGG